MVGGYESCHNGYGKEGRRKNGVISLQSWWEGGKKTTQVYHKSMKLFWRYYELSQLVTEFIDKSVLPVAISNPAELIHKKTPECWTDSCSVDLILENPADPHINVSCHKLHKIRSQST